MEKFVKHIGEAVVLDHANIDTDQIIPKQFLKRIERTGYGEFLFYDWRFKPDGSLIEDFVLNRPEAAGASILITGDNFGCGSSREHAPWSLFDHGFRVIVAPGFADIFYNNSLKTGLLPLRLAAPKCAELAHHAAEPGHLVTVDLDSLEVSDNKGFSSTFELDEFRRFCLLNGLDDIGLSLRHEAEIREHEERTRQTQPFLAFNA